MNAKNTSYRLSYNKEGLNIQGLFYSSGQERYLRLKKYLNGIDLQKHPYMRFQFKTTESIDTNQEKLWIEFRGRYGSNRNFIQRLGGSRFKEDQGYRVNLLKELKKVYPDSSNFTLDDIAVNIDPTLGKFDERLLSYSSDRWTSDKETQIFIKALQIFGVKEKDIEGMLKKMAVREVETPRSIVVNDITWASEAIANTKFQHKSFGDEQYIRSHFKDDGLKEEGTILKAVFEQPLELHHIQTLEFDYSLDNPGVQGIVIVPEFDAAYRTSSISFLNLSEKDGHLSCNIAEKIKDASRENESASAKLTSLLFFLVKKPGINCRENDLTDAYTFSIKNVGFTTTTTTTTTVYEQLLSKPLVEFNGKRYSLGDGFKRGKQRRCPE